MTTLAHDAGPRTDVDVPAPVATPALAESSLPPTPGQVDKMLGAVSGAQIQETAQAGVAGAGQALPYADVIQRAFGKHDISNVRAHVGGDAARAAGTLGAKAYAFGVNQIAFASMPDLHTAAHEAAHAIQQRNGAVSGAGLGADDDTHERHADRVADKVVAGESAEALLDDTTRGGAAANGAVVQRKLADTVKAKALAPLDQPLTPALHGQATPTPTLNLFSGSKQVAVVHEAVAPGPVLQKALDTAAQGPNTHGLPESATLGRFLDQNRALAQASAFSWSTGGGGARTAFDGPPVAKYVEGLVYTSDPKVAHTMTEKLAYSRGSDHEPFTAEIHASQNVLAKVTGGTITGTQRLETAADGALFGVWTNREPDAGARIVGSLVETQAFVDVLAPAGAGALTKWFQTVGSNVFDGKKSAREWLDATHANGPRQLEVMRSLQLLVRQGVARANDLMDELVDAMRAIIDDPKMSKAKRTVVENRLLDSGIARNVAIDAAKVGAATNAPDKHADTDDANFDRMRLAGDILARRELVPHLVACLDPVAFILAHPPESGALGTQTAAWVIREAERMGARIEAFMARGLTSVTLDPADTLAGLPSAQIPGASHDNAIGAARLGAVEALRDAAREMPSGGAGITGHMGILNGLTRVHSGYNGGAGANKAVGISANSGASELTGRELDQDVALISGVMERLKKSSNEEMRNRGVALDTLLGRLDSKSMRTDIAALRDTTAQDKAQVQKGAAVQAVQGVAYTQALAAKTESNLAYKIAADRYAREFRENLDGKFEEKEGGSKWVTTGSLVANGAKEGIDLVVAKLAASGGATLVGPGVGIALVGIDLLITFRDWQVKKELAKAKAKMTDELNTTMAAAEKAMLSKIHAGAETEVKVAAAAQARPTEGMKAYASMAASGKAATLPTPVPLGTLEQHELDAVHAEMLANPGPVQSELADGYVDSITASGKDLWKKFESAIDDMSGTWK